MTLMNLTILADATALLPLDTTTLAFVFLYIGPEIILPVASAIASLIGLILMFWRYVTKTVRTFFRRLFSGKKGALETDAALAVAADHAVAPEQVDFEREDTPNVNAENKTVASVSVDVQR